MQNSPEKDDFVLWVRVKPRSRRDTIIGWDKDGYLEMQLRAVPQRGEANRSCRHLLAQALGIAGSSIHLEKGRTSGHKRIRVEGLTIEKAKKQLDAVINGQGLKKGKK